MTRGVGEGRLIYIRNKWRKEGLKFWLKEWDPDLPDGIIFVIRPLTGDNYYELIIGADENEKIKLFYVAGKGEAISSFLLIYLWFRAVFKEAAPYKPNTF